MLVTAGLGGTLATAGWGDIEIILIVDFSTGVMEEYIYDKYINLYI